MPIRLSIQQFLPVDAERRRRLMAALMFRFAPTIVGLAVFGLIVFLYGHAVNIYYDVLLAAGIHPWVFPFIDSSYMYAMKECWLRGVDVYRGVPCDRDGIPVTKMAYSPLWQRLPFLPVSSAARVPVGVATDILFLFSLALLPPARAVGEVIIRCFATVSTMVCFALERNNIDVWMFLLVVCGLACFIRPGFSRAFAYGLFLIGGLLKYYPFVLFGLALKERPRRFYGIAALCAIVLVVFSVLYWGELREESHNIPVGSPIGEVFGITNIPLFCYLGLSIVAHVGHGVAGAGFWLVRLALTVVVCFLAVILARRPGFGEAMRRLPEAESLWLVAGCLLVGGCYMMGQSNGYRGIFLLIVLSGFLALRRAALSPGVTADLAVTVWLLLPVMWMEALRGLVRVGLMLLGCPAPVAKALELVVWAGRELLWLNLERVMLAVLIAFLAQSVVGRATPWLARQRWAKRLATD